MVDTSATGGVLQPSVSSPPFSGQTLLTYMQNWIAPLTTLDPTLVRPRWQSEPSNIPDAGTCWMACGFSGEEKSDTFPFVGFDPVTLAFTLQRNEEMMLLCSFYDTGVTGEADAQSRLLRDNLAIPQNREPLYPIGFDLAYVGNRTPAPRTLASRWLYRVDLPIVVRCQFTRIYQVLTVASATGEVFTDVGIDFPIAASGG